MKHAPFVVSELEYAQKVGELPFFDFPLLPEGDSWFDINGQPGDNLLKALRLPRPSLILNFAVAGDEIRKMVRRIPTDWQQNRACQRSGLALTESPIEARFTAPLRLEPACDRGHAASRLLTSPPSRKPMQMLLLLTLLMTVAATQAQSNDATNYLGDKLRVTADTMVNRPDGTQGCLIAGSTMRAIGTKENDTNTLALLVPEGDRKTECDNQTKLIFTKAYHASIARLKASGLSRTGATYGALVVPFKYQLRGQHDFTGSATLGGYVGYRFERPQRLGITATPIAFFGASNLSVDNGDSGPKNVMGASYGLGLIGTLKDDFQVGAVLGWDRAGKTSGYEYNGKPWIAVSIGFAFLR